ncbi:MAG: putative RNA methyltransferase [Butyricicoccus sp.]
MLICPNCGKPLTRQERSLRCENRHSFDLASSGYCNLLLSSRSGDHIGDAKEMVLARREFLDRGYYQPLAQAVCERVRELCAGRRCNVVDAGCGEGYYTRQVAETLDAAGSLREMIGADISKAATQYAAKRDKRTQYITASSYQLPLAEHSADVVLSLFAPTPAQEFARILRSDGAALCVVPGEMHLWELKCAVYDTPYRNREEKHTLEGFRLADRRLVEYTVTIDRPKDIQTLFAMTPYSHRTPAEGKRRLAALRELTVTLSFALLTFEGER